MFYNIEHRSKTFWLDVAKCGNPDWISKAGPNQIVPFWRKITSRRLIFDARRTPTRWPNLFSLLLHHLWLSSCQLSPPLSFFSISSSLTCIAHLVPACVRVKKHFRGCRDQFLRTPHPHPHLRPDRHQQRQVYWLPLFEMWGTIRNRNHSRREFPSWGKVTNESQLCRIFFCAGDSWSEVGKEKEPWMQF